MFGIFLCTFVLLNVNTWNREIENILLHDKNFNIGKTELLYLETVSNQMVPLRFSGMSTSERKMFSNKIQASPTYSILTRKRKDFTDCWNSVSIKQVRLTQFWQEFSKKLQDKVLAGFNQASSTYSILTYLRRRYNEIMGYVSIKQVRLTQFWRILGDDTMKSWATFQSSKSNLLNSDTLTVLKPVLPE